MLVSRQLTRLSPPSDLLSPDNDSTSFVKASMTDARRFSVKKLRISEGIFVNLPIALSLVVKSLVTSKLLNFRDIRKFSKLFLCLNPGGQPKSET